MRAPALAPMKSLHALVCASALLLAACAAPAPRLDAATDATSCSNGRQRMARIELYFGLSRPGGIGSEDEFRAFIDAQVTPRFPDGLTLLAGSGQYRDARGVLHVEGAKLLILLVAPSDAQLDSKIDAIRDAYRQ